MEIGLSPLWFIYTAQKLKKFFMQDLELSYVPTIAIHPDKIVYYKRFFGHRSPYRNSIPDIFLPTDNKHKGNVSKKASRKIDRAISYLITCARVKPLNSWKHQKVFPFRVAFITLTLPSSQVHDDKVIMKQCFHHFLVRAKQLWKVHNYVWRAEKQKNGNIHFHILVDKYVPWSELRDTWNNITNKLGYVNRYRDEQTKFHAGGFRCRTELLAKWSYKKQIKAYHEGRANDWNSPNSTDVHAVKKVQNIKAYVCKYMIKSSQADADISRLWGCSYELSRAKGAILELDSYVCNALSKVRSFFRPVEITHDHFSVMLLDWWQLARAGLEDLFQPFAEYMLQQFNYKLQVAV
jgi:hypothetical protein